MVCRIRFPNLLPLPKFVRRKQCCGWWLPACTCYRGHLQFVQRISCTSFDRGARGGCRRAYSGLWLPSCTWGMWSWAERTSPRGRRLREGSPWGSGTRLLRRHSPPCAGSYSTSLVLSILSVMTGMTHRCTGRFLGTGSSPCTGFKGTRLVQQCAAPGTPRLAFCECPFGMPLPSAPSVCPLRVPLQHAPFRVPLRYATRGDPLGLRFSLVQQRTQECHGLLLSVQV